MEVLKKRIRQHWTKRKVFDRLLFPISNVNKSIISIDSFRALDTTRIFVYKTNNLYSYEDDFIWQIPITYLCNRITGGRIVDKDGNIIGGLIEAIGMIKTRNLKK